MKKKLVIGLLMTYTIGQIYFHLSPLLNYRPALIMTSLTTIVFFVFSVTHAMMRFGRLHTAIFVLMTFVVSSFYEIIGVLTGAIFGPYHYTDKLAFKLFGLVPLLVPLAWFMMIYASYDLAKIILGGNSLYSIRKRFGVGKALIWALMASGLSAVTMSAWDLVMDPQMVAEGFWVWKTDGAYFGIPARNFLGWLAATFTIYISYSLFELCLPLPSNTELQDDRLLLHLPAVSYTITGLSGCISALQRNQPAIFVIGFFSMGGLVIAAFAILWYRHTLVKTDSL